MFLSSVPGRGAADREASSAIKSAGEETEEVRVLVLEEFLRLGRVPTRTELAQHLRRTMSELDRSLNLLEREDILVLGEDGKIKAAYPYSALQTKHRVKIDGKVLFANCAVDALGIPFMIRYDAVIRSECGLCEAPLCIVFDDSKISFSHPSRIRVWYVPPQSSGASVDCQCPIINFFCIEKHLEKWQSKHSGPAGRSLTLKEAAEHGRTTYGNSLRINYKSSNRK
jgi:hypothetical protein